MLAGFASLSRRPGLWPYASVPALVLIALNALFVFAALSWLRPWLVTELPATTSWYGQVGTSLVAWLVTLLAAFAGMFVALALAPPLSAPALERLVGEVEAELGIPARPPIGFLREISCGFRALAAALLVSLPLLALLFAIDLLFPPAAVVIIPAKFLIGALLLAWSLFDYPLTLRGVEVRDRFGLLRAHLRPLLGFGAAFSLLFWLPCCGVVLLPVGVTAGTRLLYEILKASPETLPNLPRDAGRSGG